jgi:hypothetical protein
MSEVTIVLEWNFSPPDYFEEPIAVSRDEYTMSIAIGKVEARIPAAVYDANPSLRTNIHDALQDRFLAVQLLSHKAYHLSKSSMMRVHPDGRRDIFMELEPGRLTLSGGSVDFQVIDKNGNIVSDSKRERLEKKRSLSDLVIKYRPTDVLLDAILKSYESAVRDPNNELVHLYEIREGLSKKFGGETATRSTLMIDAPDWSRFGQLCNSEPLRQGRHRGKNIGVLRDATESELAEARSIARAMIEAYLQSLESKPV